MAESTVTRKTGERGPTVTEVAVPSFSTAGVEYTVKLYHRADGSPLGSTCTCKAEVYGSGCSKHKAIAPALLKIRSLSFGAARHEARLMELAKRLYTKPRKTETAASSYDLALEVDTERYSTPQLRRDSWKRHGIVVERCFGDDGRAA